MNLAIFGATGKTGKLIVEQAPDQAVAIEQAVSGVDAVVSAMRDGGGTLTTFGRNVASAMTRRRVSSIVSLVVARVSEPSNPASLSRA